jgi:hypothetical protein
MPGKPFTENDPRIWRNGRPRKKEFLELWQEEFGGKLFDKDGNPISFEKIVANKIAKKAFEDDEAAFLKLMAQVTGRREPPPPDEETVLSKRRAEAARAEKMEIANQKARNELIYRPYVARTLGRVYAVIRSIFLATGPAIAGTIAAELEIKDDARRLRIEELITTQNYQALSAIKREINDFLQAVEEPQIEDGETKTPRRKKPSG